MSPEVTLSTKTHGRIAVSVDVTSLLDNAVDCVVVRPHPDFTGCGEGLRTVFSELARVLRPRGTAWIVLMDRPAGSSWKVVFTLQRDGWLLRNALIVAARPPRIGHETVFLLVKQARYHFDLDAIIARWGKNPGDVWPMGPDVLEACITAGCPTDGIVLDLLGGSDTERIVCRLGRRCASEIVRPTA